MDISVFFRSIIDSDTDPVVICDTEHRIVYMNPSAADRYSQYGGYSLVGKSLLECHSSDSNDKIVKVLEWFGKSVLNNRIFTFHNAKENVDVYMIALRKEDGSLIGYYEKHERRNAEKCRFYDTD